MPAAIPAVVGLAATTVAVEAGLVLAGTFAASAVGFAASGLASVALGALTRPKAPDLSSFMSNPGAGRTTMLRQPITAHEIVYGRIKKSGPMSKAHSQEDDFGRTYGNLYVAVALAACHIRGIRTVYFGDRLATDELFQHPGRQIRLGYALGDPDQVANAEWVAEIGDPIFGANHRGRGIAYILARLTYDLTDLSHLEDIAAIIDGHDEIFDPRTDTTGYSNNAALCIANWLTSPWGKNLTWSRLDEDALIEAANICDERVRVRAGSCEFTADATSNELTLGAGARSLDWGDGVRVASGGTLPAGLAADTTYFVICADEERIKLATTAANALAGAAIDITTAGSGTHTLTYWDEARYKLNGSFSLDVENGEVLDQMRQAMAGWVFPRGGKWFIHAGAAATPTVTLTEDALAGSFTVVPKRSMRDRINGMRCVLVRPEASWQPDDAPVLQPTAALLEEDAGEERYGDLRLNFVTSTRQAQRLMKIERERNRRQMTAEAPWKLTAMKIAPVDGLLLTIDRYFTEKQFRAEGWKFNPDCTVTLSLREDDEDVYAWDPATDEQEEIEHEGSSLPSGGSGIEGATDLLVDPTPETLETTSWPLTWSASPAPGVSGYEVQYTSEPGGAFYTWLTVAGTSTTVTTEETTNGHDFRVRALGTGVTSDYIENLAPDAPTLFSSPDDGELEWTNAADAAEVQIFKDGVYLQTETVTASPQLVTGLTAGSYRVRSVNAGGNVSSFAGPLTVS